MVEANVKIIEELKSYLQIVAGDNSIRRLFTTKASDFIRERKLPIQKVIALIINFLKRSLSIEVQEFFDHISQGDISCTKGAFCLQRLKLKPMFFQVWNQLLIDGFYHYYGDAVKRWKGFRVLATDGSTVYLLNKKEVVDRFGTQDNKHVQVPMARIVQMHDVLNDMIVWGGIFPFKCAEQEVVFEQKSRYPVDSVLLFDRGYPSYALMYLLINEEQPRHFVMRCSTIFNNYVREFMRSSRHSKIVEFKATSKAIEQLRKQGHIVTADTSIRVRMVKIRLATGETEVLLTNLYDDKTYTLDDLKQLYGSRWSIETTYEKQKNKQQMEQFSGHKPVNIEQDYYAGLFVLNLQSLIEKQCSTYVTEMSENRKYNYKINTNVSLAAMKHHIVKLFLCEDVTSTLIGLQKAFERNLEPLRPHRRCPRIRKSKRFKGKYQTFTNYKRAI